MRHDIMKCPDCDSLIIKGINNDWWCDNCDAYYGNLSQWKWIKLEHNSDKKLLKDIYELSSRSFTALCRYGSGLNIELLEKIRNISLSAFQQVSIDPVSDVNDAKNQCDI